MGAKLSYPSVDLAGKVALVTGANTGIGYETAKALASLGAHTIIACRSLEKAAASVERMKAELGSETEGLEVKVETMQLDLGSFHSTRECADAFKSRNLPLHLLINNAGVAWLQELTTTNDNHETMFQVNHLSPLLLTLELLPTLVETASSGSGGGDCRVVWVASMAHERGIWDPRNMNGEISYSPTTFYQNSKLYNVMTAFNLQRRLPNSGVTVSVLHPGVIRSDLWRNLGDKGAFNILAKLGKPFMRNVKDGAATTINCAVNPALNSQQCFYYSNCAPRQPTWVARREEYQEELWDISINAISQYLSPDVLEKFGASRVPTSSPGGDSSGQPTQPAAATEQGEGEEPSEMEEGGRQSPTKDT